MQAAAKANYPAHILGMTAMTGTSQAWFLEGHDTFASIAESQAALDKPEFGALDAADAELRTGSRSMIAVYRPDLSYAADKANLPKMRFFNIETIRVRAGPGPEVRRSGQGADCGGREIGRQPTAGDLRSGIRARPTAHIFCWSRWRL